MFALKISVNINSIKTIEYVPLKIKADSKQRDELVKNLLEKTVADLTKGKKAIKKQELQGYFDKNFPDKNIKVKLENGSCIASVEDLQDEKTMKLKGFDLFLRFNKKDELKINGKNKIAITHELSHLFDIITHPKYNHGVFKKNILKTTGDANIKDCAQIKAAESIYKHLVYTQEAAIFSKKDFKKDLERTMHYYNLNSEEKIASLKFWSNCIQTEIKAYSNGMKLSNRNLMEKIIDFPSSLMLNGKSCKFNEKLEVVNAKLSELIKEERKMNAEKIKLNA